jgi:hypothetical protein
MWRTCQLDQITRVMTPSKLGREKIVLCLLMVISSSLLYFRGCSFLIFALFWQWHLKCSIEQTCSWNGEEACLFASHNSCVRRF